MRECWQTGKKLYTIPAVLVAVLAGLCVVAALHLVDNQPRVVLAIRSAFESVPAGTLLFYLAAYLAVFVVTGLLLVLVYGAFGVALARRQREDAAQPTKVAPFGKVLRSHFAKYAGIILLCWVIWIVGHLPGPFDDDTVWQLLIWQNPSAWTGHHPWATTALYGAFIDMGMALGSSGIGLMAHSVLVALLNAAALAFMLCYLRRFAVPKPLFVGCLVCICAVPCFASYGSEMVKDSSFTWAWVFFSVLFAECARTRGACLRKPQYPVALLMLGLWLCLTRKTGIYLVVIAFVVLLVLLTPCKRLLIAGMMAALLAVTSVYSAVLLPAWGVAPASSREAFSLVLQQTARCVSAFPDDITTEERQAIDAVVPVDHMQRLYDPLRADQVKDAWQNPTTQQVLDYMGAWARMGLRHPVTYVQAAFLNAKELFVPTTYMETKNETSAAWVDDLGQYFSTGGNEAKQTAMLDGLKQFGALDGVRAVQNAYERILCYYTPVRVFFSTAFLSFWLPLMVLLFVCFSKGAVVRRSAVVALVPSALMALTLLAGPIVLPRYCLPAAFVFPLVLLLPFVFAKAGSGAAEQK